MTRKFILISILIFVLAAVCAYWFRPIVFLTLLVSGRNPVCDQSEAWRGFKEKHTRQEELRSYLESEIHLVRADDDGNELYEVSGSTIWVPAGNRRMLLYILTEIERGVYQSSTCRVKAGDVVLDCGAHVGLFTRQALKDGADLVVAVEPSRENLECLKRNLATEISKRRVILYPKGVWNREERLVMKEVPDFSAADRLVLSANTTGNGAYEVQLTTVDRLTKELNLKRVDFIKMNIEGAEQKALEGSRETLSRFKPMLAISATHLHDDTEKIPQLVKMARDDYRMSCGTCYVDKEKLLILPDVLFFY
ncbi:MAG: FkbM family methyltransferase [Acidobacteria bacterium]|nr:FkbM family methyltransferase [Acidobacteriota bacterium]